MANSGIGKTTLIAIVAALIGGGVGGGVAAHYIDNNVSSSATTSVPKKAGTAEISNVTVKTTSDYTKAFNKVKGAVVSVINLQKEQDSSDSDFGSLFGSGGTTNGDTNSDSSSSSSKLEEYSEGSGVIYKKEDGSAYIVTNNHVVSGSDKLEVILSDGTKLTATKVGTDSATDLAVLKIDGSKVSTVATFGDSSAITAGEPVIAIGSPLGSEYATSVTQGIVSAKSRTVAVTDEDTGQETGEQTVIQTDAAINPGNSGGPLVNMGGQVIGINSMKLSSSTDGSSVEGMGFAIPSDQVVSIIDQLITDGKVKRPALGVKVLDLSNVSSSQQKSILKLPSSITSGVVIGSVSSNTPASAAGLKKYDVIVSVNGKKVTSVAELHTELYKYKVGATIKLGYYRGSDLKSVQVHLTKTAD
ncbi:serine protease do-like htrA [Lactobacillus selangorensis]|uniref:Serine protease do-like htrA n=1 Tax=Lactobacillus selangorensis TaxID=81857 RepID=A0A0R2FTZ3_9LACO|nr:trypsin-like peptidase domain-containing protein [Lactobacillus selangorensis]KRN28668.1 serine protease do-like htrA [Lactobacillus selangorensis]KRN32922.1 serine protease do-like htrA [Lactobacillus selangorensis]